jgi:hypothetical protein
MQARLNSDAAFAAIVTRGGIDASRLTGDARTSTAARPHDKE